MLGGTFASAGGSVGLIGTYAVASGTTGTVAFAGAYLGWQGDGAAVLVGSGTLVSSGSASMQDYYSEIELRLSGGVTWENTGSIYQYGSIAFGNGTLDSATLVNAAGAVYDLTEGNSQILATGSGPYRFVNAGLLEMTGGGNDNVDVALTNSGVVSADAGSLYLRGPVDNSGMLETGGGFWRWLGAARWAARSAAATGLRALVGTFAVAGGTIGTVTLGGAYFGWQGDGDAVLSGPRHAGHPGQRQHHELFRHHRGGAGERHHLGQRRHGLPGPVSCSSAPPAATARRWSTWPAASST